MQLKAFLKSSVCIICLAICFSCKEEKITTTKDNIEVRFKKEGTLQIRKANSDSIIKTLDIEIADNE